MTLKTLFEKPVDRKIEGVIKADDETSLRLEIEEYVLTKEVEKRLEAFFDAYNNYKGENGVWISGFFGSGKSHLLKMLALLMENREVEGVPVMDLILPKCQDNEILRGDLKRAVGIPSQSILFNIDQKADVISKTQIDALLAVFVKVFDESCGYYGKQPYIAQFERELDQDNLFEKFKETFKEISSHGWEWGRMRAKRFSSNIDEAYEKVTGQSASGILDKYRADYRLSIEDFADQVQSYIESQGKDFRLNFYVDEVGQYVADNQKLMTNLQTLAESLATKSRGRAWLIVTAQEEMKNIFGEMGKQQGIDFSKIQARFANRMKLTSADVAEVIQKRLLTKNDDGIRILSDFYHEQVNNFKTLFDFADGGQTYRNFQDRDHFIHSYPFIPYQFTLFQSAIENLSLHNAFEGKHSSVGERSMLGVFQQVAIQIANHDPGQLATFDLMFEGIRTALKSQIQRAVTVAEKQLDNKFAIRLLKALFLVKYVKEFKATVRNLCVLMYERFDQDLTELRENVEEALNLLEQQTYIQRNGDVYEYLTDEEKDVEQEIKNTQVETTDVADELAKAIFDHVIKTRKIRYEDSGQDYPYTRKLDDRLHGKEYELAIHVISPFHENAENEFMLKAQATGRSELLVVMPSDERIVRDLLMYKRTEKYVRQNVSITQQESIRRILTDKEFQNRERYIEVQQRIKTLLGKAKLFASGSEIELNGDNAQNKVLKGFNELIVRVYPNLRMLRGITYTENDIKKYLNETKGSLFDSDATSLEESEQEVLAFIQGNDRTGVRTALKDLIAKFESKPYGWPYAAVLCVVAKLFVRGKIEVKIDSNLLENNELEKALRNTHAHVNVIIEPLPEIPKPKIRALKDLYNDFFDTPPQSNEPKALVKEFNTALQDMQNQILQLIHQTSEYPFLENLDPMIEKLKEISGKRHNWYFNELLNMEDELLDIKENILDPVREFMNGPQKEIYDTTKQFIQAQEPNFGYLDGDEPKQIKKMVFDPECFKGSRIQQVKSLRDSLKQKVETQTQKEIASAKKSAATLKKRLEAMDEFAGLSEDRQKQILAPFDEFIRTIEKQKLIAVIRDTARRFEEDEYNRLLSKVCSWSNETTKETQPYGEPVEPSGKINEDDKPKTKPVEYVPSRALKVPFSKAWLANETDVDEYLAALKKECLKQISEGKRIQI